MTRDEMQKMKRDLGEANTKMLQRFFPEARICFAMNELLLITGTEIEAIAKSLIAKRETELFVLLSIEGLEIKTFDGELCVHYFIDTYGWVDKDGITWYRLDMDEYFFDAVHRDLKCIDIDPIESF